jgi:catechol 2,3-dioxygenase-like lactoylglutathione lyase family enzyme
MASIRHVAYMVENMEVLRDFYVQAFGFEEVLVRDDAIWVIDGMTNITFIRRRDVLAEPTGPFYRADGSDVDQRQGISHFGFLVDDDNVEETMDRIGRENTHEPSPVDGRAAEMRVMDPWSNGFDLSKRGYMGREEQRLPAVRQLVIQNDRPDQMAHFYESGLALKEIERAADASIVMSDGLLRLLLVQEGLTEKSGLQYIGIQIDSWDAAAERFRTLGRELAVPADRGAEVLIHDPEGNVLVLSEKGWPA